MNNNLACDKCLSLCKAVFQFGDGITDKRYTYCWECTKKEDWDIAKRIN